MLFAWITKYWKDAVSVLLVVPLVLLWFGDHSLALKALGTLGIFVGSALLGWYGAAFAAWRNERKNL